jgi:Lon protease-like protein
LNEHVPSRPVPLFPLPGVFLFPSQLLPLHIFEARYRQMVEDVLDGPGHIVMGTTRPDGGEPNALEISGTETSAGGNDAPSILPVAGLGEIVRHEKLPDGRFNLWLLGIARVRVREVASDRLYRRVECLPFTETAPTKEESRLLRHRLRAATEARLRKPMPLPESAPTVLLTDLLIQTLSLPQDLLESLYTDPSVADRARGALRAHASLPVPPAPASDDAGED